MFTDISVSTDLNAKFSAYLKSEKIDLGINFSIYVLQVSLTFLADFLEPAIIESLAGRETSTATLPMHPTNQRCWFQASHESAHSAGISCCPSPNETLYAILQALNALYLNLLCVGGRVAA